MARSSRFVLPVFLISLSAANKIDSIQTSITKDKHVFVRITAGDLTGWGECYYNSESSDLQTTIADKVHRWIAPHILGEEFKTPEDIDAVAEKVWRKNYKHTGTVLAQALAGVDTALWDIVARSQNVSVCSLVAEFMGGSCKSKVPVYGSNGNRKMSPKDIVANAVHNRDTYGVKAFKFQIADRMGGDVDIKKGRTEELIPLARQQLGPDVTLMADANGGYDNYTHAREVAKLLAQNNFTWFEEPFPFWEYEKAAALRKEMESKIGIALGEQEFRLDVWERSIHAMQYAQPDVHYIGGVSRTLRVAKMSMAANSTFVPHSPHPDMVDIFALSMLAAVPNAFEFMEFDAVNTQNPPSGDAYFSEKAFHITDGAMAVPSGPGWGVTLKPGLLHKAVNQTSTKTMSSDSPHLMV